MRKLLLCSIFALSCLAGEPLMRFDFSQVKDGVVPNSGTAKQYQAQIKGKVVLEGKALRMDGLTNQIFVTGTENLDLSRNYTFTLLYKRENPPNNDKSNLLIDSFFAKKGVFVMSKYQSNFYANAKCDGKWAISTLKSGVFAQDDLEWHHVAMSIEYRLNWNDAEEWVEYVFYKDGVCCGRYRHKDIRLDKTSNLLEIGTNTGMGDPWLLGGLIADARVYEGVLSEAEIRENVLEQTLAKPAFKVEYRMTKEEEEALARKRLHPALASAIRNLSTLDPQRCDWRALMNNPGKSLKLLDGKDSCLVLVAVDGYAAICSWYDKLAKRELLKGDNAFVSWKIEHWKANGKGGMASARVEAFEPYDKRVASTVNEPPRKSSGTWRLAIQYDCPAPSFTAITSFVFANDRLEFTHTAQSREQGKTLHSVSYPKCALKQFGGQGETLAVPEGCGVLYPQPCERNARFANPYPRSVATMQFCAYYDQAGGVYVATQDPWARRKEMLFLGALGRLDGSYTWRVPYDQPGTPNQFDTECPVALQLFRGDWYDAGLIYKKDVAAMKADWWQPQLPRTTSRQDIRENCLWLNTSYFGKIPDAMFRFRDYLGQDFYVGDIWSWWERGVGTHLAPTMRAKPEWIDYVRTLKEHGISSTPYMDGRLWAERDRRGEDWMFSQFGHKMNVVSDGVPIREMYANPCDVVCPATPEYQDHFFEFIKTITMQGLNGLYIDQLGAGFPPPCHVAAHGHPYADWYTSYRNGYAKLLRRLRAYWATQNKEMVLSTEDAVEQFCTLLDIFQPYRWIHENQVPMFPLVYSGRIQFYNRNALTKEARFQTTAEQLLNAEQPGIFGTGELTAAFNHDMRQYAKRLAWTRHALLNFFNEGQMARPPVMEQSMPRIRRCWGKFGTQYVTKPQVQCAAWDYGTTRVAILINTEETPHTNTVRFELPAKNCAYEILHCDAEPVQGKVSGRTAKFPFTLNPRMLMLIVTYPNRNRPDKLLERIHTDFQTVRNTLTEEDPFRRTDWPDTKPIDAAQGSNLVDSVYASGCRPSREFQRIDYISYATLYPGIVDFGSTPKKELVLEVACASPMGGKLQIYLDNLEQNGVIAELPLSTDFKTADWNTFVELRTSFRKPVTGQHKIFVIAPGQGFCNLRKWRAE